ncbi:MAG: 1-acyl-sn-glycerol-3-phosphate acyltransferase [Saprospiraceae bacterium]|nr:1-acyl-sn-glycerol-3-phosphate acyltransferase [Saprospiraceae bacterium]
MQKNEIRLELYEDDEAKQAIQELFSYQSFLDGMKAFLPEQFNNWILQVKNSIETTLDFQHNIILPFLKIIEKISISKLTSSGLDQLDQNGKYLFISNHRDIVLDPAFLNVVLYEHGFKTSQIAIGDNLMMDRISELLFKINRSFAVKRSGTPRELYEHSMKLSNYIKDVITNNKDSVWIAQREGRAKDGNDRTQIGLLNMLALSNEGNLKQHFLDFNMVPVAISYEYDPCGMLKTLEYLSQQANTGVKRTFQKDVEHILRGLKGQKGHIHIHFGKPLHEELDVLNETVNKKQQLESLAAIIDKSIHFNYKLHPVNYVAYDLLHQTNKYVQQYDEKALEFYTQFFEDQLQQLKPEEYEIGRTYLLGMYANPVKVKFD